MSPSRFPSRFLSLIALFNYVLPQSNASPTPASAVQHVHVPRSAQPASVDDIVDTLLVGNGSSNPEMESQMKDKASSVTVLSQSEISAFAPFTHYASTAYCDPTTTINWSCGANCDANPSFEPIASGGNGGTEQFWYVGYDPTLDTVIVAHQGTDTSMLAAVATDANFLFSPLSLEPDLFPGISPTVLVHSGFRISHKNSAAEILNATQTAMEQFDTTHVTVVGHSLGAALALLEMVYLPLHLPETTTFDMYGYGMPRVGNKAFADYVDANVIGHVRRVNNKKDIVPVIPLRLMGFRHPSGEKHITESGEWVACSGQENTDAQCTLGTVPTIFNGDAGDHSGPYDGIEMGC
ncbi:hypothetical protein VKT23_018616 [Stygiomarasmius scandens]|uniref:Fungal lipase-type domain-containing protein n=1 Tax=Marasmiellus scandens TaxID=2682957 RepID=A0ABR1IT18_9AGAR